MKKALKIGGSLFVGILVLALFTLRLMGLEPAYLDPSGEEFARSNRIRQTRIVASWGGCQRGGC